MKTIGIAGFSTWVITILCLTPVAALGQQEAGVLEEITVTATRREQRVQDLPASVTTFTSEQLNELRVLQPQDLAEQTPGLLAKYGPTGLATVGFYIRGVGINDFTLQRVAIHVLIGFGDFRYLLLGQFFLPHRQLHVPLCCPNTKG